MEGRARAVSVMSWERGDVVSVGCDDNGYGHFCIIRHTNGISTLYGHMIVSPFVVVGEHVEKGQAIGLISSEAHYQASHIHFATSDENLQAIATK